MTCDTIPAERKLNKIEIAKMKLNYKTHETLKKKIIDAVHFTTLLLTNLTQFEIVLSIRHLMIMTIMMLFIIHLNNPQD